MSRTPHKHENQGNQTRTVPAERDMLFHSATCAQSDTNATLLGKTNCFFPTIACIIYEMMSRKLVRESLHYPGTLHDPIPRNEQQRLWKCRSGLFINSTHKMHVLWFYLQILSRLFPRALGEHEQPRPWLSPQCSWGPQVFPNKTEAV